MPGVFITYRREDSAELPATRFSKSIKMFIPKGMKMSMAIYLPEKLNFLREKPNYLR